MLTFLDKIPYATPRSRRVCFWLIVIFLCYVLAGFFVLPPIIESAIQEQGSIQLHRNTSVEKVTFNPLTLRLEIQNLEIKKSEDEGHLLSLGFMSLRPSLASLWRFAPIIADLSLRNMTVDVTFFGDGKYSISDLIPPAQPTPPTTPETKSDNEMVPFALHGFEMDNATIIFDDKPHNKRHVISQLTMMIPFTSSFLDDRKQFMQPKFTAVVNGDPFELKGKILPFDNSLRTEFQLGAMDIDLGQYWGYLPFETPLKLATGRFTSDISLFFDRPDTKQIHLFLGGGGSIDDFSLTAPGEGTVLSFKKISFDMENFSLGSHELSMTDLTVDHPYCKIIKNKDNSLNWQQYALAEQKTEPTSSKNDKDDSRLLLDLHSLAVKTGVVDWVDRSLPEEFKRSFNEITLTGRDISTRKDTPGTFSLSVGNTERIVADGSLTLDPIEAQSNLHLNGLDIPTLNPYIGREFPIIADSGSLTAQASFRLKVSETPLELDVGNGTLTFSDFALRIPENPTPSLDFKTLTFAGTTLSLASQALTIADISLVKPTIRIERDKSGTLDLIDIFNKKMEPSQTGKDSKATTEKEVEWKADITAFHMQEGKILFKDQTLSRTTTMDLNAIKADINGMSTYSPKPVTYEIASGWGKNGHITALGRVALNSLKGKGTLRVKNANLDALDPILGEYTELLFAGGTAYADLQYSHNGQGTLHFSVQGNAGVKKVSLKDKTGHGELTGIESLDFADINFTNEPYRLTIASIGLNGPRASVEFNEKGQLNIRRAFHIPEPSSETEAETAPTKEAEKDTGTSVSPRADAENGTPTSPKTFLETLKIGKVTMQNGKISLRDASVSPTYTTEINDIKLNLTEITQARETRPRMTLSAAVGPTPVAVTGVLNPIITPIYSDLNISMKGLELVPLSPYTVRSLAYPIEKGRLSADVKFKTENWVLSADNTFFIEQLILGAKDKRPNAPSVPVKFGLALLQDSNGDMELNLPIRGRLDDPDFRIGGIVFRAITSLFVKALASPFSLIGSIFGGGGENMDFVVFEPGKHSLDAAGKRKLEATIKALSQRSALKLEIDGGIDPIADSQGLQDVIFDNKLKQQKYDSLSRKERAATTVEELTIAPDEYEEFLFEAYKEEPDPDDIRPTTLFMVDIQPVPIMEKFIQDHIIITKNLLDELAMQRAAAVKTYILTQNPSLAERVYLLDKHSETTKKAGVPQYRADLGIR
ncbi:DUF748 domain-containing protein [Pseudodesulfovibrio piezophilus]|uniref:DUF748 domain-containing protein n=1 Tax=Pseudodesulfovibrio piezophilus (strain DSM 21447 / JCM 15486 / C1TLV30) TaxID=1322246 RepID=M1WS36_PSEP2|nr:DUF748 domain-containing protein [Pseudodesulfovibrio piezophilus]CCH48702.1 conserved protein of unknown function [Pseudodesulfovibrio piezophilus C1TLV30]